MLSWRVLVLANLIAAITVGIATATNNEETDIAADGESEVPEMPIEYSNDTDADLRRTHYKVLMIKEPPPIDDSRSPTTDPCGTPTIECPCPNSPYRTMDGTCNNLLFTARGSAGSAFSRVQKGRYAHNGKVLTKTANGRLPLPRVLSYKLFKDKDKPDRRATNAVIAWGQMVAHDGSFIQEDGIGPDGNPIRCCTEDNQMLKHDVPPKCIPLKIPRNDPFYSMFHIRCIEMKRAKILNTTGCSNPEINQISAASHYLDLSQSYGNSESVVNKLRKFFKGQLRDKILPRPFGRREAYLPQVAKPTESCFVDKNSDSCYDSGDFRVNQNLGLAVFQTIILREHNRIAEELSELNPHWDDETLFQEARRISIAQYQHITYKEFLPLNIGKELMERLRLVPPKRGFTNFYSPKFDPSTMSEFSAAAFRSFHGLVPNDYDFADEGRFPFRKIFLKDIYVNPGVIEEKHNFDALGRGFTSQPCQSPDPHFASGVTKFLLKLPGVSHGEDLEATDIQRGRDHGLPSYNDMRFYCGLPRAKHFKDLLDLIPKKYVRLLKSLYHDVDDIDLFVGGVLEHRGVLRDSGALMGQTFGCIIGEQFWRWKLGDRYFYDLSNKDGSFTLDQINGIKKTSLAALLCENLSIKHIQKHAFEQVSKRNKLKRCRDIKRMDLSGFLNYTPKPRC